MIRGATGCCASAALTEPNVARYATRVARAKRRRYVITEYPSSASNAPRMRALLACPCRLI
jgi:hypothetical protein